MIGLAASTDNKMVWGGMWGSVHLIPFTWPHYLIRSIFFGLIVSTVHCAIVFPAQDGGLFASKYGDAAFVIVYITDAAWAIVSGIAFFTLRKWFFKERAPSTAFAYTGASYGAAGTESINRVSAVDPLLP